VILPSPSSLLSFSLSLFLALFAPNAFRRQIRRQTFTEEEEEEEEEEGSFFFEGILEGKNSFSIKRREKKKEGPSKN